MTKSLSTNAFSEKGSCAAKKEKAIWLTLFTILCLQLICIVQIHSIVGHLTIWDTLLLLIIRIDKSPFVGKWFKHQNKTFQRSFFHVVACITVEALLFVAFTHSMEAVFCDEANSRLSISFLGITTLNVIFKLLAISSFRIRLIKIVHQCVLHLLVPAGLFILFAINHFYSAEEAYYFSRLDPWLSMALCIFITLILVPVFFHHIPCFLCNSPDGIDIEKFKTEIETKFPRTKCLHMHIFRIHPNSSFDAILHIAINLKNCKKSSIAEGNFETIQNSQKIDEITKTKPNHSKWQEDEWALSQVEELITELQRVLYKAGAQKVTIQPHIVEDHNSGKTAWSLCKKKYCSDTKGCCAIFEK